MGGKGYEAKYKGNLTPKQRQRLGIPKGAKNITRTVVGGMYRITYEEVVNGVTIIRTRWKKKKTREKTRTTKRKK